MDIFEKCGQFTDARLAKGDGVVADKDDHASIVDGCLLALGEMRRFSHNDLTHLDRVLSGIDEKVGRMVVVDGVFSMGGDLAPLPGLIEGCRAHGARLMVDDAHSLGIMGGGRGTAAHFGVTEHVDLIMGTFSKSFASLGGFIAGDDDVVHYIQHHARSLIFSASMPASNVAAVLASLDIMETEPERVDRLWAVTERLGAGLEALGFNMGPSVTPIIPIQTGDVATTILAWKKGFDAGLYTNAVLAPAPPGPPASTGPRLGWVVPPEAPPVRALHRKTSSLMALEGIPLDLQAGD